MRDKREQALQQVGQAIQAIDAFIQSSEWVAVEYRYRNQIQRMRQHLADMLASLETDADFQPVRDIRMGWVIVDSWPTVRVGEEASELARLGAAISSAEHTYEAYAKKTR